MTTTINSPAPEAASRPRAALAHRLPIRPHVVGALFRRNFFAYFTNVSGYVFLMLFVLVCSAAQFWLPVFFANNLANLDPLNQWMPFILLFFVPAITMSAWAEERKQGTEELLLTLPARDVEIVAGKYLAALGIYTVALAFLAVGFLMVFWGLGTPDVGLIVSTFLGYWLMGVMLIAIGMVASVLSSNVTVAFILGAVFCAVPVFAKLFGSPNAGWARRSVEGLSISEQFRGFGSGVISLSGVVYFVAFVLAMLYLNMVLLGWRNWAGGPQRGKRWLHAGVRIAAMLVALVSLDLFVQKTLGSWRIDATEEQLHSLSPASLSLIKKIPAERPVFIQAYLSPEVPRELVQTRLDLIDALNEYAAIAGNRIQLKIFDAKVASPAAREAEKRFGIVPRRVASFSDARQTTSEVIMGVAFSSGLEEVVIPFFERGLPIEYEITRSIRVVSGTKRKKVGILGTDAKLLGGMNFQSFSQENEWLIVTELKKQYEVTQIAADVPIPTNLDALVVAQPSSLTQKQIDNLTAYVRQGGPTVLLMDPLPMEDPSLAPREQRQSPNAMFGGPPPEPKGKLDTLLDSIGLEWPDNQLVWNNFNPHKQLTVSPEVIFIGSSSTRDAFGDDPASRGLQDVVLIGAGELRRKATSTLDFAPLLRTDELGGTVTYEDLMSQGMASVSGRRRDLVRQMSGRAYTLAARLKGTLPAPTPPPAKDEKTPPPTPPPVEIKVIAVADLDFISDQFFRLRNNRPEEVETLDFDNVSFMLNCVDELAGDESFIPLRRRRARHRTLSAIEAQSREILKKTDEELREADKEAVAELKTANDRLQEQIKQISENKDLDERTKETTARYRQQVENQRLEIATVEIENRKKQRIQEAQGRGEESIRQLQDGVRARALILPPLPIILLAAFVFTTRVRREKLGANLNRYS